MPGLSKYAVRVAVLSVAVLVVACAGKSHHAGYESFDTAEAAKLFAAGYAEISDVYIEDVDVPSLTLAGLEELAEMDPKLGILETPGFIELSIDGRHIRAFAIPRDTGDTDAWGRLTASVIQDGLRYSTTLQDLPVNELYKTVFEGTLSKLDRYSRYASAEKAAENRAQRSGFGGIGVHIRGTEAGVEILSVVEGGPAHGGGLREGDVILAVDGHSALNMDQKKVVNLLRGRIDTSLDLLIAPAEASQTGTKAVTLTRRHIVPQTVYYERDGDAAYIRISSFNKETADSLREVIERAQKEIGPELSGYILDLRDNRGGLLSQAVAVADLFIDEGPIVSTRGRHPDSHQSFDAGARAVDSQRPILVLVNGASASASEIVASALQDSRRAVVVGSASFGKGSVQTVLSLPNQGALTLTWARFHAPSGYALSRRGVLPNICTSKIDQETDVIVAALDTGDLIVDRALYSRQIDPFDEETIDTFREECPTHREMHRSDLDVAHRLLSDDKLYKTLVGPLPATLAHAEDDRP